MRTWVSLAVITVIVVLAIACGGEPDYESGRTGSASANAPVSYPNVALVPLRTSRPRTLDVESPTFTPRPKPTSGPTYTPGPTSTPWPTITPVTGSLFILLSDGQFFLTAEADPHFDVAKGDLLVLIDGKRYCNSSRIYADDGPVELSCIAEERSHTTVERVSAQTSMGDLRCGKYVKSDRKLTTFVCNWR